MVAFVVGGGGGGLVLLVVADEAGAGDDICGNNRFLASYPESLLYNTSGTIASFSFSLTEKSLISYLNSGKQKKQEHISNSASFLSRRMRRRVHAPQAPPQAVHPVP